MIGADQNDEGTEMADQFDNDKLNQRAAELHELAVRARAAYQTRLVDDGERLGVSRDQLARTAHGEEQQRAAAELQSRRELAAAEKADRAAAELERKAGRAESWNSASEELREQAAEQRALAEVARRRAHAADLESDRLRLAARDHKVEVEALEAQLKSNDRMKAIEREVDNVEWHARNAESMAEAARHVRTLDRQIADATTRSETKLATKLTEEVNLQRLHRHRERSGRVDGRRSGRPGAPRRDRHRASPRASAKCPASRRVPVLRPRWSPARPRATDHAADSSTAVIETAGAADPTFDEARAADTDASAATDSTAAQPGDDPSAATATEAEASMNGTSDDSTATRHAAADPTFEAATASRTAFGESAGDDVAASDHLVSAPVEEPNDDSLFGTPADQGFDTYGTTSDVATANHLDPAPAEDPSYAAESWSEYQPEASFAPDDSSAAEPEQSYDTYAEQDFAAEPADDGLFVDVG